MHITELVYKSGPDSPTAHRTRACIARIDAARNAWPARARGGAAFARALRRVARAGDPIATRGWVEDEHALSWAVMQRRIGIVVSQLASGSSVRQQADFGASTGESSGPEPGVQDCHAMVPTRDGVRLSCALSFPTEHGEGPWPVLVQFRYAGDGSAPRQPMAELARHGFVVGFCLFRGVHTSEGKYEGYHTQAKDGHDVVEWLARQPFCNGKVGTFGSSQGGLRRTCLLGRRPHLSLLSI